MIIMICSVFFCGICYFVCFFIVSVVGLLSFMCFYCAVLSAVSVWRINLSLFFYPRYYYYYYCFVTSYDLESNFLLLVTPASDLLVRTIRFRSVVFCVTSSLAVIHTIHCPPWLCIVRERAWSVSRCRTTATLTGYRAWRLVVEYPQ